MNQEQSHKYAAACFSGEYASCSYACPFKMDIRSLMAKIRKGSFQGAYRIMNDALVFPEIVAEFCDAPCREHCVRNSNEQPLSVNELEKACLAYVKSKNPKPYNIPQKDKRIAVIGAGTSGLACALRLAVKKYKIDVFEKNDLPGGCILMHEKKDSFIEEIERQIQEEKITFHYETEITDLEQLSFDAVYVATGKDGNDFGLLENWNSSSFAADKEGFFLGGMLTGLSVTEGIANGVEVSRQIEKYLLSGSITEYKEEFPYEKCERYLCTDKVKDEPELQAEDGTLYSRDEAKAEASRCLQCDCSSCMESCEMLKKYKKNPLKIVKEIYTDSIVLHGMSHRTLTREVASCNMCGQCKTVCPTSVDMGAAFLFARRDRVAAGNYPAAFHEFWLDQMEKSTNEASLLRLPEGKEKCGYLFFPGCQLGSSMPETVIRTYEALLEHTGGDTGIMLTCCGAPAYWAGEEKLHEQVIRTITDFWESSGAGTVICACMTCMKVFREMMPGIPVVSLYEILEEIEPQNKEESFEGAVFDPCSARYDHKTRGSVRRLIEKTGASCSELPFHDEQAKCCGWGGHIYPANKELFHQIVENRIQAENLPYIVYCSNCRDVFLAGGKHCVHILDLYFGIGTQQRRAPTIKEKRDNSIELKKTLLKVHWNEDFVVEGFGGDAMELIMSEELKQKTESLLLSEDQLRKAIYQAESTKEKFFDERENISICSYTEGTCTIWVWYRSVKIQDAYEIINVYMHRMKVLE